MARLADPVLADRRRRQIIDAALACFRRRGFHQATMQEICAEASISAGALYRYFSSKNEIIAAIAEEFRGEEFDTFQRVAEREGLIEAMCQAAEGFFAQAAGESGALHSDVMAECLRDPALAATMARASSHAEALLAGALKDAQRAGKIASDVDPSMAASILLGAMEGIGLRQAFRDDPDATSASVQFRSLCQRYLKPVS